MNYFRKIGSALLIVVMLFSITVTPTFTHAEKQKMSEEFRSILTDGKFVFNYAKPSNKDDILAQIACDSFEDATGNFSLHNENGEVALSDDLSKITIGRWDNMEEVERHTVDAVWNYNEKAYKAAQSFVKNLPIEDSKSTFFYLTDLEYMNYLVNNLSPSSEFDEMANYSGELKAITNNTNFSIKMESRAGGGNPFFDTRSGITRMYYRDSVYKVWLNEIHVQANHAIYVPEETPDTKDALVAAAQKRVDDYIGKNVIKITDAGKTISQYYEDEITSFDSQIANLQQELLRLQAIITTEQAKDPTLQDINLISETEVKIFLIESDLDSLTSQKEWTEEDYNNGEYHYDHMKNAVGDYIFNVTIKGSDECYSFVIIKDNSMLTVPTYQNVDISTDVSVSTDSSEVPLDTIIAVDKISEGKEHDRICGVLDTKDNEMFDIKLHSGSMDSYITKLKNGKFNVRLPIPEKYENKKLIVYYVDTNGNKTEHSVTVKNGFASFETDHFSIYTLTTIPEPESTLPATPSATPATSTPEPENESTPQATSTPKPESENTLPTTSAPTSENENTPPTTPATSTPKAENAKNSSNMLLWLIPLLVFGVALAVTIYIVIKRKTS